jgi:hypothetical protein
VNCGVGDLRFDRQTTIATAAVSLQRFAGASIPFPAVECPAPPVPCSTVFHITVPATPGQVPVNGVLVDATFEVGFDIIPSVYPFVVEEVRCYGGVGGRCQRGDPTKDADELWFFKTDEPGALAQPLRDCSGPSDPSLCLEDQFFDPITGDLVGRVHKPGGDGKVMGFCLRSVPIGAPC